VIPFDEVILHQDAHLLVVDKPHFLPVVPSGDVPQDQTVLVRLKRKLGLDELVPIHRIDRDTAGLVLFSKRPASRAAYSALFRQAPGPQDLPGHRALARRPALPQTRQSRIEEAGHFMLQREVDGPPNAVTHIEPAGCPG
jgi:tRNA pseudouridine32 synthase/23S rRNA pseudouridine746 synthase